MARLLTSSAAVANFRSLYAPIACRRPEGNRPLSFECWAACFSLSREPAFSRRVVIKIYLRLRAVLLERPLARDADSRAVRDAVLLRGELERAVLLRRVVREALRRFVPVLRRAVDLRDVDLREVDLREVEVRVDFRAVDLRPVDLRAVDLRAVDLRPDDFRVVLRDAVLRPEALRPEALRGDAPVLPEASRRFVRARLRLFSAGLS